MAESKTAPATDTDPVVKELTDRLDSAAAALQEHDTRRDALAAEVSRYSRALSALNGDTETASKPARTASSGKADARTADQLRADLLDAIKADPGNSAAHYARVVKATSNATKLRLDELLESGTITKQGEKKGTKYAVLG